jgi:hypothetical protein
VNLLPSEAKPRSASLNDQVREGTAVRTGDESRSELTFLDLTITRLGANSIFSFNKAGRDVDLSSGSILLRVPKDSGGAIIRTSGVTAGIAGTTVILEAARSSRSKLIVLEGHSRLTLRKYPDQRKEVRAGQMLDVPPGATTLPDPVNVNLQDVMRTHPLVKDFAPLPSEPLIADEIRRQQNPGFVSSPPRPPTSLGGMRLPPSAYPPTRPPGRPPQPPPPMTGGATGGTTTVPPPVTGEEAGGTTPVPPTGHSPRPGHGRPTVGQTGTVGTATRPTPTPPPIITKTSPTPAPKLKPWQQAILGGGAQTQARPTPTPGPRFRSVPGRSRKKPTPPPIR